jgi:hypothetical protein
MTLPRRREMVSTTKWDEGGNPQCSGFRVSRSRPWGRGYLRARSFCHGASAWKWKCGTDLWPCGVVGQSQTLQAVFFSLLTIKKVL